LLHGRPQVLLFLHHHERQLNHEVHDQGNVQPVVAVLLHHVPP